MTTMFDSLIIDSIEPKTKDGYLKAFARVARSGIQVYKGRELGRPEMDDVAVYRPENEVFARDALASMANRPVTLQHPDEFVNAANWKRHAVGYTGDEVVRDGDHVRVPLMLTDQAAIEACESGTRELSMGYSTDLKWKPGMTADGKPYDVVQTQIRANHLALVREARGGPTLKIGDTMKTCDSCGAKMADDATQCPECQEPVNDDDMYDRDFSTEERKKLAKSGAAMPGGGFPIANVGDLRNAIRAIGRAKNPAAAKAHIVKRAGALGATSELPDDWKSSTKDADLFGTTRGVRKMLSTIMVDSVPVELDDQAAAIVQNQIRKLTQAVADAKAKADKSDSDQEEYDKEKKKNMDEAKKQIDAKDGEIAALKKQLADSAVTPEVLDALVKERGAVIERASLILDAKRFVFDGKSLADIRRAAVAVKLGDAAVKDMSDDGIGGAFTALTADAKAGDSSGVRSLSSALNAVGQPLDYSKVTDVRSLTLEDAKAARDAAWREKQERDRNAWKRPAAG